MRKWPFHSAWIRIRESFWNKLEIISCQICDKHFENGLLTPAGICGRLGFKSDGVGSGISTRTMHQSTTLSLSQIIWPRWASRQFFSLLIVQTLLPAIFGYSLSSEAVVMKQLRRWKRLWRRSLTRSHKRTSMGPSRSCCNGTSALQTEENTSKGTRVSCVYYQ